MRKALSITLMLVVALAVPALAKSVDQTGGLQKFMLEDTTPNANLSSNTGVFGAAQIATTYFGGTFWASDSSRWEAIADSIWTFDTGVGSSFSPVPAMNPYKAVGLHTLMEGWIGVDLTYGDLTYFRRVTSGCTVNGSGAMWAGVTQAEADQLCWPAGQGYGNNWLVCINHDTNFTTATGTGVNLTYDYVADTEPGFDYQYLVVDTTGALDGSAEVVAFATTGPASGTANITFTAGVDMRSDGGPFNIKFCAFSDGGYSDEDGLYTTTCGALAVDNVVLKDGAVVIHSADFNIDNNGWVLSAPVPGLGGDWSDLKSQGDLADVLTPCGCDFMRAGKDTVLVFEDLEAGGHGLYQDNIAMSPWIDLLAAGRVGAPQKFFRFDGYFELPLLNYIFVQTVAQWYPAVCSITTKYITSPITSDGFVRYFGGVPTCRMYVPGADTAVYLNFSTVIASTAEQVRIGLGTLNYCRFYGNCTGVTNSTPWFDNVALGCAGIPGAPVISLRTIDTPQDSFPENGSLRIGSAGRLDCNNIKGFPTPEPFSSTGDTLCVNGGAGGSEVYVQFAVDPGPGCTAAVAAWITGGGFAYEGSWNGQLWYSARLDSSESGGGPVANKWMTTRIEGSSGFVGTDSDRDPNDLDPNGGMTRLLNDIFPDNLFTPGTRVNMFFKAKFLAGSSWYTTPDTATVRPFEMEVLPSSFAADSTFNCVLFVDHATDRGSAVWIEPALQTVMTGTSANFEGTPYDRWDVQAPSSQQASYGRPLNTEFGATIVQTLGYKAVVWNSAALAAFCLVKEDADVLIPWLTLTEPGLGFNNLYLNGDGIAESITLEAASEPSALRLLNEFCGVQFNCATLRDPSCPVGSGIQDLTACVNIDPVLGATVAGSLGGGRAVQHFGQGNGCPQLRSFDVLSLYGGALGAPAGDEMYNSAAKPGITYASVSNLSSGGPDYKTVVDGISLHYRRSSDAPCAFGVASSTPDPAILERVQEVLTWFGYDGVPDPCNDPTAGTSVPVDPRQPSFKTGLANFAPNPLLNGAKGTIQFTMARDAKAAVEIFDVNGRLVRTVFDGVAKEGLNVIHWDGTDSGSRPVASGVYFYRLKANDEEFAKKLVVVRNGN